MLQLTKYQTPKHNTGLFKEKKERCTSYGQENVTFIWWFIMSYNKKIFWGCLIMNLDSCVNPQTIFEQK